MVADRREAVVVGLVEGREEITRGLIKPDMQGPHPGVLLQRHFEIGLSA
jgi:hypothetical protein